MSPTPETERDALKPLRAREAQVLTLLLAGRTLAEICAATRISRQTVWRIRTRPEFEVAIAAARSELLSGVLHKLQNDASDYADVLHALATNEKARGSDRVQAARNGLDLMFRGVELFDIEDRLQKLEAIAGGRK